MPTRLPRYIMTMTVLVYVVPVMLMASCYYQAARFLTKAHANGEATTYDWASHRNVNKVGRCGLYC